MREKLLIIGAGGHGKVIADIAFKNGYREIMFLDDNEEIQVCGGYPVVGRNSEAKKLDADIIVGIGNGNVRKRIQESLHDTKIVTLVHPNAVVADGVTIGCGTVIMAGTVVNPGTTIGKGCIINTCSSVDHDCVIGDYVHVAAGSHLCGTVIVDDDNWIGAGTTISNNIHICRSCIVGAGTVVVKSIEKQGTYVGVPARRLG